MSRDEVSELFFGRSNVTDLSGVSDNRFISFVRSSIGLASSISDSSESHNVSLFIESSSVVGREAISGFRSFSKRFMQRRVGCSPPQLSHCSGGPTSSLICSAYVPVGFSLFRSTCRVRALASVFVDALDCGVFVARFRVSASILREWLGRGVRRSDSCFARFFRAWASFFSDLLG